jgi:hypothetical protein
MNVIEASGLGKRYGSTLLSPLLIAATRLAGPPPRGLTRPRHSSAWRRGGPGFFPLRSGLMACGMRVRVTLIS